ncbi:MAG: hypothetical protein IJT27_05835 [Clostridia bacterium]|nr:hypothetical protein [Clostridia bacterium]
MRQFISVCGLFTRQTIFKVLAVLAGMSGIQVVLAFFLRNDSLSKYFATDSHYYMLHTLDQYSFNAENTIDKSTWSSGGGTVVTPQLGPYVIVLILAFLLFTMLLCGSQYGSNKKPDLTLRRLAIKEKTIFFTQGLINTVWFLLFWSVEAVTFFLLKKHYFSVNLPQDQAAYYTLQLFREFNFPQSLLSPFNFSLAAVLGFSVADFSFSHRNNKLGIYIALIAGITLFTYTKSYFLFVLGAMTVLTIGKIIYDIRHMGEDEIFRFPEDSEPEVIVQ